MKSSSQDTGSPSISPEGKTVDSAWPERRNPGQNESTDKWFLFVKVMTDLDGSTSVAVQFYWETLKEKERHFMKIYYKIIIHLTLRHLSLFGRF